MEANGLEKLVFGSSVSAIGFVVFSTRQRRRQGSNTAIVHPVQRMQSLDDHLNERVWKRVDWENCHNRVLHCIPDKFADVANERRSSRTLRKPFCADA